MKSCIYQIAIVSFITLLSSCSNYVITKPEKGVWSKTAPIEQPVVNNYN